MSEACRELGAYIEAKRPDCVLAWDVTQGELNVDVAPRILRACRLFENGPTCKFSTLG